MRRRLLIPIVVLTGLAASTGVALGVGPWPGVANSVTDQQSGVRYAITRSQDATTIRALRGDTVIATGKVDGHWGIPAVTSVGQAGGLSPNGKTLVLSTPPTYAGLRSESQLLLLATRTLTLEKTVTLAGEFGYDAISPDSRTLYLLQHVSTHDLISYRVRAYDLRQDRLLKRVIVAKGETETMRGWPVSRATSRTGAWVYTLYHRESGAPFIHALNTAQRYAVCIDLTWQPAADEAWTVRLKLSTDGRTLLVRQSGATVSTVDTKTFRVS
jgi:dipeptidyl aminopeptidase/acylaminoacyl peptidase